MSVDKIFAIVVGVLLIAFIYWFFFGKKEKVVKVSGLVEIAVSGGYSPEAVVVEMGKPITLAFTRTDRNSCLEELVIPDFKIKKNLPLNQKISISIIPEKEGEFIYHCGMNMYRGKIIVKK